MHIIKPKIYDDFKCMANECKITCCMEWKIAVDEDTYTTWKEKTLNGVELTKCVEGNQEERMIKLNEKKYCPYMNKEKLCNLVIEFGDEILSHTCDTFPRQEKNFEDRTEKSLVSCCPRTIELILEQGASIYEEILTFESDDILYEIRNMLIELFDKREYSSSDSLLIGFAALIDMLNKEVLEKMDIKKYCFKESCESIYKYYSKFNTDIMDTFIEGNELFLDIIENYRKEERYIAYIEPLAKLAEAFEEEYDAIKEEEYNEFIQKLDEFDYVLKAYLINELFSNLLLPEADMESIVIQYEWIGMVYAIVRHALFLKWSIDKKDHLELEEIIESIVLISRITGYGEEDIYEYIENSFEDSIWEFGYMLLIVR
ncbi:MAG: flagellin lysine-N-methylase [Lachnospiraceae bacterium]